MEWTGSTREELLPDEMLRFWQALSSRSREFPWLRAGWSEFRHVWPQYQAIIEYTALQLPPQDQHGYKIATQKLLCGDLPGVICLEWSPTGTEQLNPFLGTASHVSSSLAEQSANVQQDGHNESIRVQTSAEGTEFASTMPPDSNGTASQLTESSIFKLAGAINHIVAPIQGRRETHERPRMHARSFSNPYSTHKAHSVNPSRHISGGESLQQGDGSPARELASTRDLQGSQWQLRQPLVPQAQAEAQVSEPGL